MTIQFYVKLVFDNGSFLSGLWAKLTSSSCVSYSDGEGHVHETVGEISQPNTSIRQSA